MHMIKIVQQGEDSRLTGQHKLNASQTVCPDLSDCEPLEGPDYAQAKLQRIPISAFSRT